MVGGRAKGVYEKQAKERQKLDNASKVNCPDSMKGQARDKAGEAAGVSGKSVDRAAKVLASGSKELINIRSTHYPAARTRTRSETAIKWSFWPLDFPSISHAE
jgi:hypothetical protein